jgi:hypothetical protein
MLKLISFFVFEGVSTLEDLLIDFSSQIISIHYKIQVNESPYHTDFNCFGHYGNINGFNSEPFISFDPNIE